MIIPLLLNWLLLVNSNANDANLAISRRVMSTEVFDAKLEE